ncbi:uncharacterized protein LOC135497181 [Lineus longissimus]|uniref:uncharacterized protein LOC135494063 n=1 Tax=Lineus longissimus TaxID=88925 RepID=UPI00315D1524
MVPCFAHGAIRFDQHLLIKAIARRNEERRVSPPRILPRNTEHYLAVFDREIVFQDSFEFMKASLSSIAESMKNAKSTVGGSNAKNPTVFPLLWEYVRGNTEQYELLSRKGVFCYDFLDGEDKLKLDKLPSKEVFYDSLREVSVTEAEYKHAERVWRAAACQNLKDYLLVYLITDVLLLADCFEKFRDLSLGHFQMDTAKFLTLPHFAFHAMLKRTQVRLDVLHDLEMVQWVKRGVRGGVASIMLRHAEANIPEMGRNYRPEEPRQEIMALDCTNLYGHALSKNLPEKNYRWLSKNEISKLNVTEIPDDARTGFILSVDLTYPAELHERHTMYPLAPHKAVIPPAQWSDYTYELGLRLGEASFFKSGQEKLVPDLTEKRDYVVHYQNLKYYLKCGMRLRRIRRVLAFEQRCWMHDFVDFITSKRSKAVSDFESSFWKLILNSIFGRLLIDKTKHVNMKLVSNEAAFKKLSSKPNFKSVTFYDKTLVGVQSTPASVELNSPVVAGFTVLELSKLHMYKFHYNFVLPVLGGPENCQLLMTDTDSLVYLVKNIEPKVIFSSVAPQYFDFSNFPRAHELYSEVNKKIKGTFKIEYPGESIVAFVGVRAKMYCFKFLSEGREAKAKGIPRTALQKLHFENYHDALFEPEKPQRCHFKAIRSIKHDLFTLSGDKKGLSCLDLKRWVRSDGIQTYAYGDFRCNRQPPSPVPSLGSSSSSEDDEK